ncbi:hypothetical protein P9112_006945 [Eukaryota sp. TZLM1-RC]
MSSPSDHSCPEIDPADIVLGQKIGQGGFASVFSAKWFSLAVAIKLVFLPDEGKAKLKKEISLLSMLNSPAILRVFGVTYIDDKIGIVMELATSSLTIPSSLNKHTLAMAKELCCAMKVLHSKSVVHGDLKPQNILLVNGQIRLADFGTSRVIADHTANSTSLTFTPKYAALEVFDNSITKASDVYSIGVILYELLTNNVAFEGLNSQLAFLGAKFHQKQLLFDQKIPDVLQILINTCIANEPSKRPTIDQIIEALSLLEKQAEKSLLPDEINPNSRKNCQNSAELIQKLALEKSNLCLKIEELSQILEHKDQEINNRDQLINQLRSEINISNSKIDELFQKQEELKRHINSIQTIHGNIIENTRSGKRSGLLILSDSSSDEEEINDGNLDENLEVVPRVVVLENELKQENQQLQEELSRINGINDSLKNDNKELNQKLTNQESSSLESTKHLQKRITDLTNELNGKNDEISVLNDKLAQNQTLINEGEGKISNVQACYDRLKADSINKKDEFNARIKELDTEKQRMQSTINKLLDEVQQCAAKISEHSKELKTGKDNIKALISEKESLNKQNQELNQLNGDQERKLIQLNNEKQQLTHQLENLNIISAEFSLTKDIVESLKREIDLLKQDNTQVKTKCQSLEDINTDLKKRHSHDIQQLEESFKTKEEANEKLLNGKSTIETIQF